MATQAIVSVVLKQLISMTSKKLHQEYRLVADVTKEIEKLTSNFQAIQAVLIDAEEKHVRYKVVAHWLDKLKDVSYDMDDVLDEWNTAVLKLQIDGVENAYIRKKKVCFCFPLPRFTFKQITLRGDISLKIKEINKSVDLIVKEKDTCSLTTIRSSEEPKRLKTTSFVDVSTLVGRDIEKNSLINKLLGESLEEEKNLPIISIVGMGGIGKTILAQFAYNDEDVKNNFHKRIWVCISDPFDEIRIAKAIIEGLTNKVSKFVELQSLLKFIQDSVIETKFLLILDDVWIEDNNKWEPLYNTLNSGLHGSKILVITRKTTVAHMMKSTDIINVKELSEDGSWLLFKQLAFSGKSKEECEILVEIGREIVGKCKGLPLAIKTIGSLLRFKNTREQWKRILDSEMWKLEGLENVFYPLLLSYNDLPFKVKGCFLYCAIYPKNHNIEKDELIKLWMAQGYLDLEQNEDLELIGEDYFEDLTMRSFFQEFKNDDDGNITNCKMHDIVHDFALFLVKKDCFAMKIDSHEVLSLDSIYEKAHHSMLIVDNKEASFPLNKCSIQKLRSLLVRSDRGDNLSMNELLQSNLLEQLTCLRLLEISNNMMEGNRPIQNIPKEIGKLIHLRYLYLFLLKIKELPDTLCDLLNLQTLKLTFCIFLENLPKRMGKLVNLRHLELVDNFDLKYMPKGVEKLTNLRTLSTLIVGGGREVCRLDCLKNLNQLRGRLTLEGLSNVLDEDEAKNARLKNKDNILHLNLIFDSLSEEASSSKDEAVLEALESPPYLKRLSITGYGGIAFPNWIVSLAHLKRIFLSEALKCEHLPALGKLPLLQELSTMNIRRLKRVGNEILVVENHSASSLPLIAFPKLKILKFWGLEEWEEWDYENTKDIIIMPSLSKLKIRCCPKLKALPDHLLHLTSLQKLYIDGSCDLSEHLPALGKLPLLESLDIREMKSLKRVGNEFLGVEDSSSSASSSPPIAFPKLKNLVFWGLKEWEEWDYENTNNIIIMPSLCELKIRSCPKLKALPDHFLHPTLLQTLRIIYCPLLNNWWQTKGFVYV